MPSEGPEKGVTRALLVEMATEAFLYVWNLTALQRTNSAIGGSTGRCQLNPSEVLDDLWEILDRNRVKPIPKRHKHETEDEAATRGKRYEVTWSRLLRHEWEDVEPALCFFIDAHLAGLDPAFSSQWAKQTLGVMRHDNNQGGTHFFTKFLDPDLQSAESDPGARAPEVLRRLELYLVCLHFGFRGLKKPWEIDQSKSKLARMVGGEFSLAEPPHLVCEEAYKAVRSEPLSVPAEKPLYWSLGIGAAALALAILWYFSFLYKGSVERLNDSVRRVVEIVR